MTEATAKLTRVSPRLARGAEQCFAVGMLIWLTGALNRMLYPTVVHANVVGPGKLVTRGIIVAMLLVTGLILAVNRKSVWSLVRGTWPVFLPVILAAVSVLWSVAPTLTLLSTVALGGTTGFGMFLAVRFGLEDQLKLLAIALAIVACVSVVIALVLPDYGVMTGQHAGAWMGVFPHKNALGQIMALTALVAFLLTLESRAKDLTPILGVLLSVALVFASRSRSGLIVMIACLALVGGLHLMQGLSRKRRIAVWLAAIPIGTLSAFWVASQADRILGLLGADRTFDFRTVIWRVLLSIARRRLWLGYGYGAFWRSVAAEAGGAIERLHGNPGHAHNGFVDLALELGLVGVALVVVPLGIYLRRAFARGVARPSPLQLWPAAYLTFFVLSNLPESGLLRENKVYWALYVAAAMTLGRSHPSKPGLGGAPTAPSQHPTGSPPALGA